MSSNIARAKCRPDTVRSLFAAAGDYTYWRDRFYPTRHVTPRDVTLPGGSSVHVDYALVTEVTTLLRDMVSDAAARGDNVGVDEYSGGPSSGELPIDNSEIFAVRWKDRPSGVSTTFRIPAFIVIEPGRRYVANMDPRLAVVHIFRSCDLPDATYGRLLSESVRLTSELDVGYTDCATSIAGSCDVLLEEAVREGFVETIRFPKCVNMAAVGLTDSVLMVRTFSSAPRQLRTFEQVAVALANYYNNKANNRSRFCDHAVGTSDDNDKPKEQLLLLSPFLPRQYRLSCGLTTTVRMLRMDEIPAVYRFFCSAVDAGEGFGPHQYPDLEYFRRMVLEVWRLTVALEETTSGKLIGVSSFLKSAAWSRLPAGNITTSTIIIDKQFQNRGVGKDMVDITIALARQLGYWAFIDIFDGSNSRSHKLFQIFGWKQLGVLRQARYLERSGWQDLYFVHRDLTLAPGNVDKIAADKNSASHRPRQTATGTNKSNSGTSKL